MVDVVTEETKNIMFTTYLEQLVALSQTFGVDVFAGSILLPDTGSLRDGQDGLSGRFLPCLVTADGTLVPGTVIAEPLPTLEGITFRSYGKPLDAQDVALEVFAVAKLDKVASLKRKRKALRAKMEREIAAEEAALERLATIRERAHKEGISFKASSEKQDAIDAKSKEKAKAKADAEKEAAKAEKKAAKAAK